jgi:PHP family Zn ribbon phosphoesterase
VYLIPLSEIIAKALGQHTPFTQSVTKRWDELITAFGSEINVLLDADLDQVARVTVPAITSAIQAFRDHKVIIIPGGGGKYGTIELPTDDDDLLPVSLGPKNSQTSLLDY